MWTRATRQIPAHPAEVLAVATDPATWPRWLRMADARPGSQLDSPGARSRGSVRIGHGERPVTWHVTSRLRDIIRLEAVDDGGDAVAWMEVSCSWWHGGCATEFSFETAEGPRRAWWVRYRLRHALQRLEMLAAVPAEQDAPTPQPAQGWPHGPAAARTIVGP